MRMKLLAFDLDGTLVDEHSHMTDANRQAILAARQAGLEVILVTGRSWRGTKPVYDGLGLTGPAICYLGALVVADGAGLVLSHHPLVPGAWETLRAFAVREGLPVTACVGTDQAVADGGLPTGGLVATDTAFSTRRADDFPTWDFWHPFSTTISPDLAPCAAPPIMLAVYGETAVRRALAAFPDGLPDCQFDLYDKVAGETVLHIWHSAVNKGHALAKVCATIGIAPDEVAAFGDMPMDASMLAFAGIGVAVPGAHAALKDVATWVAEPHEAIRRILEGA
ncbi:MAG TPA: HAD family hydrolase [Symbiobacteriaceae bacterium]|nr:HAD family hydrolase [Symbiobacteriaceae bacterium]